MMLVERIRVSCDMWGCHAEAFHPAKGWTSEGDRDYCRKHTAERAARHICPDDHAHAEVDGKCYTHHGCRCDPCRTWQAAYQRRLRRNHHQQRYGAAKPLPAARVDARGSRRRLQALVARGWSMSALGGMLGVSPTNAPPLFTQGKVQAARRDAIYALYQRLWNVEPPQGTAWERMARRGALKYAAGRRWVPPLAWDDIDADEQPAEGEQLDSDFIDDAVVALAIDGHKPRMTQAERAEVVRVLNREKWTDRRIAAWLGVVTETVLRSRQAAGIAGLTPEEQAA